MLKIPIHAPRVFYLNSKGSMTEEFPGRCVTKILPHGRHTHNLIEVHALSKSQMNVTSVFNVKGWSRFYLSLFYHSSSQQVITDEVQFIAESKKLAALLADPEIEVNI